jgi:hypothetical protein
VVTVSSQRPGDRLLSRSPTLRRDPAGQGEVDEDRAAQGVVAGSDSGPDPVPVEQQEQEVVDDRHRLVHGQARGR